MDRTTVRIEDISFEGQGIGRSHGLTYFVENALPGDLVEVIPTKMKKRYAFGEVLSFLEPSAARIEPQCPHEDKCGGCTFQRYSYEAQLKLKEKQIREKLIRIAGIEDPLVKPIVAMDKPFEYRNKVTLQVDPVSGDVGFHMKKSHQIVDTPYCMLQAEPANTVGQVIRKYIKNNPTNILQVIVKTAFYTGEVMVVIIAEKLALPNQDLLIQQLDEAIEALEPTDEGVTYSLENVSLKEKGKDKSLSLLENRIY